MLPPTASKNGRHYKTKPVLGYWAASSPRNGRYILYSKRFKKTLKVARLVCAAFHGPPPFEGAVTMHLDENSRNNRADNLAWGTQKENLNAPGFLAYCRERTGENNPYLKGRLIGESR